MFDPWVRKVPWRRFIWEVVPRSISLERTVRPVKYAVTVLSPTRYIVSGLAVLPVLQWSKYP